jgi:hypothetical protein
MAFLQRWIKIEFYYLISNKLAPYDRKRWIKTATNSKNWQRFNQVDYQSKADTTKRQVTVAVGVVYLIKMLQWTEPTFRFAVRMTKREINQGIEAYLMSE